MTTKNHKVTLRSLQNKLNEMAEELNVVKEELIDVKKVLTDKKSELQNLKAVAAAKNSNINRRQAQSSEGASRQILKCNVCDKSF